MKKSELIFGILRIPTDFIMAMLAFIAAYNLRQIVDLIPGINLPFDKALFQEFSAYLISISKASAVLVFLFAINKLYAIRSKSSLGKEITKVISICFIWLLFIITYFFFKREFPFSRLVLLYSCVLSILFVSSGRLIIRAIQNKFLKWGFGQRKVVFIGNNTLTNDLAKQFTYDHNYKTIGVVDKNTHQKSQLKYLGSIADLEKLIKKHKIEEIIQTNSEITQIESLHIVDYCQSNHIQYSFIPSTLEVQRTNIEIDTSRGIPLIKLKTTPLDGWNKILKRIFDIFGALTGLILLSPIFIIIALAIKLDSKGPILFCKKDDGSPVKRVGQYGKLFRFYKFRTMKPKTDSLRYTELAEKDLRKGSPLVKIKNDPRVTKLGKFLRKTSLDEIPQFWSVLTGDMSLVGPRAHLPEEVEKYEKNHYFVLNIKPGITGLPQISGRSDLDFQEEIRLDRYYIENWSLWTDIKILIKTLIVPFKKYEE